MNWTNPYPHTHTHILSIVEQEYNNNHKYTVRFIRIEYSNRIKIPLGFIIPNNNISQQYLYVIISLISLLCWIKCLQLAIRQWWFPTHSQFQITVQYSSIKYFRNDKLKIIQYLVDWMILILYDSTMKSNFCWNIRWWKQQVMFSVV